MPPYSSKFLEKKYNNWVKAQLAVLFTREGIEPFVRNDLQRFQLKSLSDICYNNGLYSGTLCSSCCTENVVKCPTNKICYVGRRTCSYHRSFTTQYFPTGCPNKICHHFKTEIQNVHRIYGPSYKNTDATQWCRNSWEVAKCFMPPNGYKDVTCASETDFNGIISVIINLKDFQSRIHENLSARNNIFEQARKIGREVRHSPALEVKDAELQQYFNVLKALLSDTEYLATDKHAQIAKQKLIDLENDTLVIGKDDIRKALDDVAKAAQDKIKTEIGKQAKQYQRIRLEMIRRKKQAIEAIENKRDICVANLEAAGRDERKEISKLAKKKRKKMKEEAETQIKRMKTRSDEDKEKKYIAAKKGTHQQMTGTDYKYPMIVLTNVNKYTDSIALYKVPLKCLPRLCQQHEYVNTLTYYCKELENELALPPMETRGTENQQEIDIFIQDKAFDIQQLVKGHGDAKKVSTKIDGISRERKDISRMKAIGLFVNSKNVQIVDSVSNNIISVYHDPNIQSYVEQENTINMVISLLEVVIFKPLFDKIKLLNELRNISLLTGKEDREFTAASIIKKFQYFYPNIQDIANEGKGDLNRCSQQNKRKLDKILGEMVALINRSNLPKGILLELKKYQTKDISKEVAEGLFQLDKDIKWCGYRYDTLHVYVQKDGNTTAKDSIATFLASNGITNYKLVYIDGELAEYSYVGSKIHNSDKELYATLGCFAEFKSGNNSTICGLISKHFANVCGEIYDEDKTPFGTVIPETKDQGVYDIAAAEIKRERILNLDTRFRNYNGDIKPAKLIQMVDDLQNQPVYLRGASTTTGVGTIEIPHYLRSDGKSFLKVSPGSYALRKPDGKLAEPGDSGAILCYDDLCQNIGICAMLIGKTEDGDFCFLPLSGGLEQLNESTKGEFELLKKLCPANSQIQRQQNCLVSSTVRTF